MALSIVGVGLGRTGTLSLKTAIEQLGFGPCFHCLDGPADVIERVFSHAFQHQSIDWDEVLTGYNAAVDSPFSWLYRDLAENCPSAKFILTVREPNAWFGSAQELQLLLRSVISPEDSIDWDARETELSAVFGAEIVEFQKFRSRDSVLAAYEQHNAAVQKSVPAARLLVFDVTAGWPPLCEFLGVAIPDAPFPQVNSRTELPSLVRRMLERSAKQPSGAH